MFQVCTLERIPYIFLCNDAIDIYIILTESHDQGLSNKPIYSLRNTLVNEIHVEQSKCPNHLKHFWGHCMLFLIDMVENCATFSFFCQGIPYSRCLAIPSKNLSSSCIVHYLAHATLRWA